MTTVMYGIKNCDTIKKAKKWLEANNLEFTFHDHRADGLDQTQLQSWCQTLGWEQVLNKRGTTYRQLSDEQKASLNEKRPSLVAGIPGHDQTSYTGC